MDYLNESNSNHVDRVAEELQIPNTFAMKLLTGFIGTLIVMVLYELWVRNSREYKLIKNMPTPPQLPLLGNAHMMFKISNAELLAMAMKYLKECGETVWVRLGHLQVTFITNPSDIELVLSSNTHIEKSEEYRYFKPWFGNGLLISNGQHWRHHRKMIAPTFHQSILRSFVPTFVKHSQRTVSRLEKLAGTTEFDIHEHMSETTVEILLTTAMGVKNLPIGKKCAEYAKAVVDMCDIIHKRQVNLLYRYDPVYNLTALKLKDDGYMNTILTLTRQIIADRQQDFNPEKDGVLDDNKSASKTLIKEGLRDDLDDIDESSDVGGKRRLALLDAMVEMNKNPDIEWNEKDIMDEVNTIMFEGHDTTSAGSSFTLCMLGIHKDIQQKVFEEQKVIFGNNMNRDCTFADTLQMNYLERVIKETLRLFPPVPMIARKVCDDVKLKSGPYTIPRDTTVVIGTFATHRREDIYENALEFNPDNFLPEVASKKHYYSYIPFSAGPRSCVGRKYAMLMLKVLLSTLIRNFSIDSSRQESDLKLQGDIILKVENGFHIALQKRAVA